jgi:hypothetical protein
MSSVVPSAYFESPKPILEGDVEAVNQQLELIRAERGDYVPEAIVEVAKNPDSILHQYFEWDDTDAAKRFRLLQAKALVRVVAVSVTKPKGPTKKRVSVAVGPSKIISDDSHASVPSPTDIRRGKLKAAIQALQSWATQNKSLAELSPIFQMADKATKLLADDELTASALGAVAEIPEELSYDDLVIAQWHEQRGYYRRDTDVGFLYVKGEVGVDIRGRFIVRYRNDPSMGGWHESSSALVTEDNIQMMRQDLGLPGSE